MKKLKFALVLLSAVALAGCETISSVDTAETSLVANNQGKIAGKKVQSGVTQFDAGNYGLAQKDFLAAVEATPKNSSAWLGLAAAYDQLGRFDLADRAYEELLSIEGRKPAILNNFGYSYLLRGETQKARSLFNEARALAPLNPRIEANWNAAYAN